MTTIRNGSRGQDVTVLQSFLGIDADGIFGPKTEAAVKEFQNEHGLDVDGIVGHLTWAAIQAESHIKDGVDSTSPPALKSNTLILIDNGHGSNTPGKCSPDRRLREYKWTREVAQMLLDRLTAEGFEAKRIVTEDYDVSLTERVRRVNAYCDARSVKNCVLISIHINAAGNGDWLNASGWAGFVAPNASNNSKRLAKILHDEAIARGLQGNRSVPPGQYWTGNFTIIKKTNCPAVLTENLFQDNRKEVEYLLSDIGKKTLVDLHVAGLKKYLAK